MARAAGGPLAFAASVSTVKTHNRTLSGHARELESPARAKLAALRRRCDRSREVETGPAPL